VDNEWVLDMGVQILPIDEPDKLAKDGWAMVQTKGEMMGVGNILSPYHVYINMCASYASTPYPRIMRHLTMQARGLAGHSNAGSCGMNSSGEINTIKQMWLSKSGVATIILLKQIKIIWPVSYNSGSNKGSFVIHSNQGDIVVCNNNKGMLFFDLWVLEAEVALGIDEDAAQDIILAMDNADLAAPVAKTNGSIEPCPKTNRQLGCYHQIHQGGQFLLGLAPARSKLTRIRGGHWSN
jgi:hypothetical protein